MSIQADKGQPTVLAKPAISVMPVMARRDSLPNSRTSAAKAASYRPQPIASPITAQAAASDHGPWASPSMTSAVAKSPPDTSSTRRPPRRSMYLPAQGLTSAEMISAIDSAAYTCDGSTPRSRAIGAASIAGR